jgi:hypothetical protein
MDYQENRGGLLALKYHYTLKYFSCNDIFLEGLILEVGSHKNIGSKFVKLIYTCGQDLIMVNLASTPPT